DHGTIGFIATKTIFQGDTRDTGLKHLLARDGKLYRAIRMLPWPGDAAVTVSVLNAAIGKPARGIQFILDGREVESINSRLRPKPERADSSDLISNQGFSFQGSITLGSGFIISPDERAELICNSERNLSVIFEYLGGHEVNTSPTQDADRYVISFGEMGLDDAEKWPELLGILEKRVKPQRDAQKDLQARKFWWQFLRPRAELYSTIAPKTRCLVTACGATKHMMFSFQPTHRIFSHGLYVFGLDSYTAFAILQSRLHELWSWLHCSTMKSDLRYSGSNCFVNFPFPKRSPGSVIPSLESCGEALYTERGKFMGDLCSGLTSFYNLLKDPECTDDNIATLRQMHEALDRAVLDAYGWSDIEVPPYCPMNEEEASAVEEFNDEVIDRLYVLNTERAAKEKEEQKATSEKPAKKSRSEKSKKKSTATKNLPGIEDT
ncbi:hypothetical protein N9B05_05030, partial [Mariniblastus sp.]|nr:hypothetical protein [Mariniblastus sp.]